MFGKVCARININNIPFVQLFKLLEKQHVVLVLIMVV